MNYIRQELAVKLHFLGLKEAAPSITQAIDFLRENHQLLIYNVYKEFGHKKFENQFVCKIEFMKGGWYVVTQEKDEDYYKLLERGVEEALKRIS